MTICSNKHDEICFEGKHCPMCTLQDKLTYEKSQLEDKIEELNNTIEMMKENQI